MVSSRLELLVYILVKETSQLDLAKSNKSNLYKLRQMTAELKIPDMKPDIKVVELN